MVRLSRILMLPAVVNVLLATLVIVIWYFYNPKSAPPPTDNVIAQLEWDINDFTPNEADERKNIAAIESKPLFHESRKPAIVTPVHKPVTPDSRSKLNDIKIRGIVYKDQDSIAYLYNRLKDTEHKLHEGESLDGWKIKSITKTEVILVRDGDQGRLSLIGKTAQ
ncbi:hypothetical protein OAE16_01655 [Porticoccaceae bacterium]|nr:hypothetical protein [Porticoccaceae bacterium]